MRFKRESRNPPKAAIKESIKPSRDNDKVVIEYQTVMTSEDDGYVEWIAYQTFAFSDHRDIYHLGSGKSVDEINATEDAWNAVRKNRGF